MNAPKDAGLSGAPPNHNEAPKDLSRFNDQFEVADLRSYVEYGNLEDASLDPEFGAVPVPLLAGDRSVHLPAAKLGLLIRSRVPEGLDGLLIASFYRMSPVAVGPVLSYCVRSLLPLIILAAATPAQWQDAIISTDRKRNSVLLCYPGNGLKKHLGIQLPDTEHGRLANGLFLVNRPSDDHVSHFYASQLPAQADGAFDLEEIKKTVELLRKLPGR